MENFKTLTGFYYQPSSVALFHTLLRSEILRLHIYTASVTITSLKLLVILLRGSNRPKKEKESIEPISLFGGGGGNSLAKKTNCSGPDLGSSSSLDKGLMHAFWIPQWFIFLREIQCKYRFSLGQANVPLLLFRNILLFWRQLDPAAECPEWAGHPSLRLPPCFPTHYCQWGGDQGRGNHEGEILSPLLPILNMCTTLYLNKVQVQTTVTLGLEHQPWDHP